MIYFKTLFRGACVLGVLAATPAWAEVPYTRPVADGPHNILRRDGSVAACYLMFKVDPDYELADDPSYVRFNDAAGIAWCQARSSGECLTLRRGATCTMVLDGMKVNCLVPLPGSTMLVESPQVCD